MTWTNSVIYVDAICVISFLRGVSIEACASVQQITGAFFLHWFFVYRCHELLLENKFVYIVLAQRNNMIWNYFKFLKQQTAVTQSWLIRQYFIIKKMNFYEVTLHLFENHEVFLSSTTSSSLTNIFCLRLRKYALCQIFCMNVIGFLKMAIVISISSLTNYVTFICA